MANQDPIILAKLCTLIILLRNRKKYQTITKDQTHTNLVICSEDDIVSNGSEDEIDENQSQQKVSQRLKQKEITEKQRSYYDAGISAEVIKKNIPGLIPNKIIISINYSIKKWPIQERKWKKKILLQKILA